jgi:hypothetical protein
MSARQTLLASPEYALMLGLRRPKDQLTKMSTAERATDATLYAKAKADVERLHRELRAEAVAAIETNCSNVSTALLAPLGAVAADADATPPILVQALNFLRGRGAPA